MELIGSSCIFPVPNIGKTTEFYRSCMGFRAVEYPDCEEPHVCLYRDTVEIILLRTNAEKVIPNRELYGYGYDAYLYTDDQERLEKEFSEKGVRIVRPLNLTDYGNKEFVIEDPDGRHIAFGSKVQS